MFSSLRFWGKTKGEAIRAGLSTPKSFTQGCSIFSSPPWMGPGDCPDPGTAPALGEVQHHEIPVVPHPLPGLNLLCAHAEIPPDLPGTRYQTHIFLPRLQIPASTSGSQRSVNPSGEQFWRLLTRAPLVGSWSQLRNNLWHQPGMQCFIFTWNICTSHLDPTVRMMEEI